MMVAGTFIPGSVSRLLPVCPVTRNGIRSSTRRRSSTRAAASSSPSSRARSRSRPARAEAIRTGTRRSRWRSRRPATPRCRRTTSSARSPREPARASTPTRSRPSLYEGYGPGGVALLIEALTDNRNRTGADVRHLLSKHGGNLGEPGSVSYLFDKRGVIVVDASRYDEDDLIAAIDAGAQDISLDEDVFEVITEPGDLGRGPRGADRGRRRDRERRRGPAPEGRGCRWRRPTRPG